MIPKSALGMAAAGAGICFIGYCVYFDRKRRSDPNFKTKLREKRRQARNNGRSSGVIEFPDMSNPQAIYNFFMKELKLGEQLLEEGDIEGGVEHLSYAVIFSGQSEQLLPILQQTLPPQAFGLLRERLPIINQKLARLSLGGGLSSPSPRPTSTAVITEDDVE